MAFGCCWDLVGKIKMQLTLAKYRAAFQAFKGKEMFSAGKFTLGAIQEATTYGARGFMICHHFPLDNYCSICTPVMLRDPR